MIVSYTTTTLTTTTTSTMNVFPNKKKLYITYHSAKHWATTSNAEFE